MYNYDIQFWVTYEGVWIKKNRHTLYPTHQGMKEFFVSDFREKFTSCSLWLLEFRSVGIFAISLLLSKILLFLNFPFLFGIFNVSSTIFELCFNFRIFDSAPQCIKILKFKINWSSFFCKKLRYAACLQSLFYINQTKINSVMKLQSSTKI